MMGILNKLGWRKRRKYPVRYDAKGRSARRRCFEMFPDNTPLAEIARMTGLKLDTVRRYRLQWKAAPDFEARYNFAKKSLLKTSPYRERTIELLAGTYKITTGQLETILSQPNGLRRLLKGNIALPVHQNAGHRLYIALAVAMTISELLERHGGQLDDVLFAFRKFMMANKQHREEEDADVKENNWRMSVIHKILEIAAEQERQGWVQPDRLTETEQDAIIRYGLDLRKKNEEALYWIGIVSYLAEGLTEEQAREKIYQDLTIEGRPDDAKKLRQYQDFIHPVSKKDKPPPSSPPEPPKG